MENVPEKDLMVDLLDKQFKTTLLQMLNELKEDMVKAKKTMYEQSGNINRKPKKKPKQKILEQKSIIIKMDISLEGFKSRYKQEEERISNLKIRQWK